MPTLNWIGKEAVTSYHNEVPFRTLEKQYVFNAEDSGNMIIHGDNLEALKALLPKYGGQVNCVYIDPPYNTGNSPDKGGWIYYDNVDSPKIRKWLGEVVGKEAEDFSRHDKWLCMMYPRLKLLQMLLAKDGAIFISIDDNEQANLKLICDEIFGARNFIDCLHWKRKKQPSFLAKHTAKVMEYVLVYAKERDSLEKLSIETLSDATKKVVNLTNQESIRHFGKGVRVKCGEKGIIPKGKYIIKTMSVEYLNDVYFENGVTTNEVDVKALFSVSQEKIDNFIAQHLLFITANFGLRRDVSEEEKTNKKAITDLLLDWGDNQDSEKELKEIFNRKTFDYSKPSKLIENIVKTISNANSIVLDSFAGSGTTAHAVLNLNKQDGGNRKFILVEMEDYADNITAERVRRVINGYGNEAKAVEELAVISLSTNSANLYSMRMVTSMKPLVRKKFGSIFGTAKHTHHIPNTMDTCWERTTQPTTISIYWCPIKISKGIKVSLNRSIYAVDIFIFQFQAPRFRKELIDVAKFHQKPPCSPSLSQDC